MDAERLLITSAEYVLERFLLEVAVSAVISSVSAVISAFLVYRYMKKDMKAEIFDFLGSQDGMILVSSVGKLVGAGFMSVMKIPAQNKNMNIFGFKVPTSVVMAVIDKSGLLGSAKEMLEKNPLLEGLTGG